MGVHGLWELLAPVGRRVSVETLAGRRLAIDASIWMVQFMKAMRDDNGEMVRNAHLLGFFRRICKLLYLRTKPVFVFDGRTPALKRRTVIARRRQRENAQSKLRKTAEKLLLNHLKAMKLRDLAEDIKKQKENQKNVSKGSEGLAKSSSEFTAAVTCEEDGEEDDEEMILPEMYGEVDPAVLASLPPSMQHGLLLQKNKHDSDAKGKKIMSDPAEMVGISSENCDAVSRSNQEKLDEMIAASIAAEMDGGVANASTSTASILVEEEVDEDDDDDDQEMILPSMHDEVDPAVLAALPPSMQLDLLVQIRERLMAENRQKYQKVKKDPLKFSELQIQSYLKTVAFRREIDQVQKAAAGRGVSGVQSSRIASEAHREFIFSSSFTGDKEVLASARADRNGDKQQALNNHPSNSMNGVPFTNNATGSTPRADTTGDKQQATSEHPSSFMDSIMSSTNVTRSTPDESRGAVDHNIETYLDERGNVRVSRVRAMGMRMTRDLQRNLDLMKEIEQEKTNSKTSSAKNILNENNTNIFRSSFGNKTVIETSRGDNDDSVDAGALSSHPGQNKVVESSLGDNDLNERNNVLKRETHIEICIEDDGKSKSFDGDDDLFASLVAGNPVITNAKGILRKQSSGSGSDSDCEWEEGIVEGNTSSFPTGVELESKVARLEDNISDDDEVEWQEGDCGIAEDTLSFPGEPGNTISKGCFEEEAGLQEAIRRSLEDIGDEKLQCSGGEVHKGAEFIDRGTKIVETVLSEKIDTNESFCDIADGVNKMNHYLGSPPVQAMENVTESEILGEGMQFATPVTPLGTKEVHAITEQALGIFDEDGGVSTFPKIFEKNITHFSDSDDDTVWVDDQKNEIEAKSSALMESFTKKLANDSHTDSNSVTEKNDNNRFQQNEHSWDKYSLEGDENARMEATEVNLEEEMLILGQERMNLGDEQKRLERNVESVSSEMFTECQELLQMFGIPYIIAPMEAEAQCAYMEFTNLVDGVVTDDSDVFLFGARSVYKNIFDERKYVETYFMKDVENELGLSRGKLIRMALLLGSDYTEGVSGIGIVNAIEVLNAFPEEDGLRKFRNWIESPDPTILGTGSSAKKRGSKFGDNDINTKSDSEEVPAFEENKQTFMDTHRKVSKNWHIPSSFPSEAVTSAYTCPQVDKSTEPFTWGKPDHFVLRKLCWEKFGWGSQKVDELLIPVLKEYDKRETQLRLEAFYTFNERFAKIRSKRIKKAVKGIAGNQSSEVMGNAAQKVSRSKKKTNVNADEAGDDTSEKLSEGTDKSALRNQSTSKGKSTIKQSRKKRKNEEPVPSEQRKLAEAGRTTNRRLRTSGRGRGRGRRVQGRGKEKENPSSEVSQTSCSSGDNEDHEMDLNMETIECSGGVRRSGRLRMPVNYTVDDVDEPLHPSDTKCSNEEAGEQVLSRDMGKYEEGASCLSEQKEQNAGNLSPGVGPYKDYLEAGGGFCPVDDETGELGLSQHGEPSFQGEVSEDYLRMGGGFCGDEGEIGNDQDGIRVQTTVTTSRNSDLPDFSGFIDKDDQSSISTKRPLVRIQDSEGLDAFETEQSINHELAAYKDDQSKSSASLQENNIDNSGQPSIGALSAMPFLRKKRKKM